MQNMYPGKVNSPQTELAQAIDDEQTTIPLLDASVLPDPPNLATIGTGENAETVLYTGINGNDLTGVTRGFQGIAQSWSAGAKVARLFTEYDYDALRQNLMSHASRHAAGGADPLTPEMIGAALAIHADQHKTGGSDPITAADIGAVSSSDFMTHISAKASDDVHGLLQLSKDVDYLNKFAYSQVIINAEESVWYDINVPGTTDAFNGIIFAALRMSDRGVAASWAVGNAVWNTAAKYAVLLGSRGNGANNEALELRVGGNAAPMQIRFTSTATTQRNIYLQAVGTSIITARS